MAEELTHAQSQPISPVADILFMRPLGFMATILGTGAFMVSAPMFAMFRPTEINVPFEALVVAPARYTWVDPLGQH